MISWGNGSLGNERSKRYKILPSLSAVTESLPTPVGDTKTFEIWDLTNTKMFQWQNTLEGDTGTLTQLSLLPNCSFSYLHYDILLPCTGLKNNWAKWLYRSASHKKKGKLLSDYKWMHIRHCIISKPQPNLTKSKGQGLLKLEGINISDSYKATCLWFI